MTTQSVDVRGMSLSQSCYSAEGLYRFVGRFAIAGSIEMSGRLLYRGSHRQQGSVGGVPKDAEDGGDVPAPQKQAHLGRGVGAIFPEEEGVGDEKESAEREVRSDDEVGEVMADEKGIHNEECG